MSLSDIYQQVILDHYKKPRNKGRLEHAVIRRHLHNPTCGDQIEVQVELDGDTIKDVRFDGHGCSISQASASMMTQASKGKPIAEAKRLIAKFKAMMRGEQDNYKELGELQALQGVSKFPVRIKCATIAWSALQEGIEMHERGEKPADIIEVQSE